MKSDFPRSLPVRETPVRRFVRPLTRFLQVESSSGILLVACTAVALVFANSDWAQAYDHFWHLKLYGGIEAHEINESLAHWVNDALMTIFFFVVGLEIKRELLDGELREPRQAVLPIMAALGGMVAPATIYLSLQYGKAGHAGWGIPMATDIAFVVGFLALLGKRVPLGLKIMLLALAIVDDIGAVLVIAIFYSSDLSFFALGLAVVGFGLVYLFNWIGVRPVPIYVFLGAGIWLAFYQSGVHPTVAGVVLGLMTPGSAWFARNVLSDMFAEFLDGLDGAVDRPDPKLRAAMVGRLKAAATETVSPLERLEISLHPWVAFLVMPVFALANAGVPVEGAAFREPVAIAVAVSLVLGKPIGILLFSALAVKAGWASLPAGVSWLAMLGGGFLAGIGFTMSLFIANLALDAEQLNAAKVGVLSGSAVSAVLGLALLWYALPPVANAE